MTPPRNARVAPQVIRRAAAHMAASGELRVYIGAGPACRTPPAPGSGVILSDLGRMEVSRLTIRRLRAVGTVHLRDGGQTPPAIWEEAAPAAVPVFRAIAAGRDVMVLA